MAGTQERTLARLPLQWPQGCHVDLHLQLNEKRSKEAGDAGETQSPCYLLVELLAGRPSGPDDGSPLMAEDESLGLRAQAEGGSVLGRAGSNHEK